MTAFINYPLTRNKREWRIYRSAAIPEYKQLAWFIPERVRSGLTVASGARNRFVDSSLEKLGKLQEDCHLNRLFGEKQKE